jgi:hypothetical protein
MLRTGTSTDGRLCLFPARTPSYTLPKAQPMNRGGRFRISCADATGRRRLPNMMTGFVLDLLAAGIVGALLFAVLRRGREAHKRPRDE